MEKIKSNFLIAIIFILIGISFLTYTIYFSMEINKHGQVIEGTICQHVFKKGNTRKGRSIIYYYHEICMDGIVRQEPKEDLFRDYFQNYTEIPGSITILLDKPHPLNGYIKFVHDLRTTNNGWDAENIEITYLLFNYYRFPFILGIVIFFGSIFMLLSLIFNWDFNFDNSSRIMILKNRVIGQIYRLKLNLVLIRLIDFIKNPQPTISSINQKKEAINTNQRNIIGISILFILLILCIKISTAFDDGNKPSAFNFDQTWIIWLVFFVLGGGIEYYLFSDNSNKKK